MKFKKRRDVNVFRTVEILNVGLYYLFRRRDNYKYKNKDKGNNMIVERNRNENKDYFYIQ